MRCRALIAALVAGLMACTSKPEGRGSELSDAASPALADSLLTLGDSLLAIHQTVPDTALLARLFPPSDSLLYVEGPVIQTIRGDSLARRTMRAHGAVREMHPRASIRHVRLLGRDGAEVTLLWEVDVLDTAGVHHPWSGPITLGVARRGDRWTIRSYRE
jgi:hypothetical protein